MVAIVITPFISATVWMTTYTITSFLGFIGCDGSCSSSGGGCGSSSGSTCSCFGNGRGCVSGSGGGGSSSGGGYSSGNNF